MKGYPKRYVILDTETNSRPATRQGWGKEQTLRLGIAKIYDPAVMPAHQCVYANFTTPDEFHAILDQMPKTDDAIYIFAHNIAFDLRIVDWFRAVRNGRYSVMPPPGMKGEGRYKTPLFIADGHPTMMRFFRTDGQHFHLWDSFNWFPVALKEVGKWIRYPKADQPKAEESDEEWFAYCQVDVDLLDRALRHLWGWLQCLRVSDWSPTPASQSSGLYRMRFAKGRIKRPEDETLLRLDRHAYYGGVTECFRIGRYDKQSYAVDVNGLYPYVMTHNLFPCEVIGHGEGLDLPADRDSLDLGRSTAEVWLQSGVHPFPVRTRSGTLWVKGRVHTVLCGPELHRAWRSGLVHRVGRWVEYKLEDLFSRFVTTFWRLRQRASERGDELIAKTCKHLLNSLHGKFGQRDGDWQYRGRTETPGYYGGGRVLGPHITGDCEARVLDGHMWHRTREEEHEHAFVPIAAWTAAYARIYMDELRHLCREDNVLYQCIDSLVVTQEGYDILHEAGIIDTGELGDFKTEDSYQWIDIQGVNQLDHCHGYKHSGVKSGSGASVDGVFTVEEWESLPQSISAGNVSSVFTRPTLVRPSRSYSRRYVHADGSTTPLTVDNWHVPLSKLADWQPDCWKSVGE